MNSKGKFLALAVVGLFFLGCSKSSEPDTINSLYRESDSYRARLFAMGCQVGHELSMGGKTAVTCTEVEDGDVLLARAQLLKDWSKVLAKIERHPELPSVAYSHYKKLQAVIMKYADEVETFVVTDRRTKKEYKDEITSAYLSLSQSILELEQKLVEYGCDFLAEPPAENFGETCDVYYAPEKIEVLGEFVILAPEAQALQTRTTGSEIEQQVKDLNVRLIDLTIALKAHINENAVTVRSSANLMATKLISDFGVVYYGSGKLIGIDLPQEKRNEEGVEQLISKVMEYVELVELMIQYDAYIDKGLLNTHKRRLDIFRQVLSQPLTLEFIIENYEPEKKEQPDIPTAPEPSHGGLVATNGSAGQLAL